MPAGTIFSLIMVVVFIFGLFYLRAYILKKASGRNWGRLGTKNIIIHERFAIDRDKTFCLAEVSGKIYFIVFAGNSVTLLDSYDAAAFSEAAAVPLDRDTVNSNPGTLVKIPVGNSFYARTTRSLARFIAARAGREEEFEKQLAAAIAADSNKTEAGDKKKVKSDEPEEKS